MISYWRSNFPVTPLINLIELIKPLWQDDLRMANLLRWINLLNDYLHVMMTVFSPSQDGLSAMILACVVTSCGESCGSSLGWVWTHPKGSISWKNKTKKVQLLKPLTENYPHFQVNKNVHQENTREKACIRSDTFFFFFFKGTRWVTGSTAPSTIWDVGGPVVYITWHALERN